MIALGIDVGRACGFAVVDLRGSAPATLLRWGTSRSGDPWRDAYRDDEGIELVAIEAPSGIVYPGRQHGVRHMLDAARLGGALAATARLAGLRVVECTAATWRARLGIRAAKGETTDHAVTRVMRMRVVDMPGQANSHVRDAIGTALWAMMTSRLEAARWSPPSSAP